MGRNSDRHGGLYKYEAVREWPSIANIDHTRRKVGIMAFSARGEHALHGSYAACSMRTPLMMIVVARRRSRGQMFQCFGFDSRVRF